MEYQKIINSELGWSKWWDVRETYNTDSQIKVKTSMLRTTLCD